MNERPFRFANRADRGTGNHVVQTRVGERYEMGCV
jgi:hypothetical protein